MKKTSSASQTRTPSRPSSLWRNLAIILGLSTLALAVLLVRVSNTLDRLSASTAAKPATSAAATLPRELMPFAALGTNMAENNRIADLGWSTAQINAFLDGMRSSCEGRGVPMNDEAHRLLDETSRRVRAMHQVDNPAPIEAYFRALRETDGVLRTTSGLHYRITEPGKGAPPRPDDTVILSLTARLPDGTELPGLNQVRARAVVRDLLPGLAEGLQMLTVGGKALVFVPPELGFGDHPPAPVPPGIPIAYLVELHDILANTPAPR